MKIAGAVLVIGSASLGGIAAAEGLRNQYRQMQYLQKVICRLKSEIRYSRSYLGEAFRQIGISSEDPYQSWLTGMAAQMERKNGQTFAEIWEKETKEKLAASALPQPIIGRLAHLGGQLGSADAEMQVKTLDFFLEELDRSLEEMYEEMKANIRLYHCLGVMSGIFVTVLLI